jgi:hypothetical protein
MGAPCTDTRAANGHGRPSASGAWLFVANTASGVVSPVVLSIIDTGMPPRIAILPAGACVTGAMLISVSSRLPQVGTWFGFAQATATFHDRIARMRTTLAPSWHGLRCDDRSTGRRTA